MFKATAYNNLQISNQSKIRILVIFLTAMILLGFLYQNLAKTEFVKYEQFRNYFCQVHGLNDSQCKDQAPSPSEFYELLEYGRNRIHELEEITKEIINWRMTESD